MNFFGWLAPLWQIPKRQIYRAHRWLMRHAESLRFYFAAVTGTIVAGASIWISALQWQASDRQAVTAERAYQLEISKNKPVFGIEVAKADKPGEIRVSVKIIDGIAIEPQVRTYGRAGSIFFHDTNSQFVICESYWSRLWDFTPPPPIKTGEIASYTISESYLNKLNEFQSKALILKYTGVELRQPSEGQFTLVSKIDYTDVFGVPRSGVAFYPRNYENRPTAGAIDQLNSTLFNPRELLPSWCDEPLEGGTSRRGRMTQDGVIFD